MDTKNVEDFYPLSPMQQGMLFHSLYSPESGMYLEQVSCTLKGDLDIAVFEQIWQDLVDRHPILRTAFVWEGLKEPIQVVHRHVKIPVQQQDWRGLSGALQTSRLERYLREERQSGFNLSQSPLMRLALIRTGEDTYYFIWSHHHILLDGWSIPLVLKEVFVTYAAASQGREIKINPGRPFRDYIVWLRRKKLEEGEAYWRRVLAGFTTPTPLVVTRDPGSGGAGDGEVAELEENLSQETTTAVMRFAKQQQITLNTLVQGAWALLLSRYSGEQDVVFGATVSGRPVDLAGAEAMIGLFINTLPVRVRLMEDVSVLTWLKDLQVQQAESRQYEYTPLVQIQGWSDTPRGQPLFQSILVFENIPLGRATEEASGSLNLVNVQTESRTNYPLTLVAVPSEEMLLKISYDTGLFEADTVRRMLGHLRTIITSIVSKPKQRLSQVELLTEEERRQLLIDWGHIHADFSQDLCIHQWVEAQVEKTPDAKAVTFEGRHLTYRELNQMANQLARYLQKLGVGPESLVGMFLERSMEMVVGILGILKAGGAYVPIDQAYPPERLAFLVDDAQMPVLLTQQKMVANLPENKACVVCLDTDWPAIALESQGFSPDENPESEVKPENVAYVIYTSGSTGKPKGVIVTHANVVRLFEATEGWYHFNEHDVWTMFHSYAFDFSVWELWGAFFYGGRVVIVPYLVSRSPEAFYELLYKEKVTVVNQTPSAFRQLIRAEELVGINSGLALRYIIFGGEALELQSLKPWFDRHGDQHPRLVNMYGITETTVHVTYRPLQASDITTASGSVIGWSIPDLRVYILDQNRRQVPVGVPGEMYVAGAGVGRGYLNRPDLTEARFIPDPFNPHPGRRVYKSGDLARYLPDGDIEYMGRIDLQVKIRGFRVELGEIESLLMQYPGIRETVVLAREDIPDHKRLVAYFVAAQGQEPGLNDLRTYLGEKLPDYMIPSAFVAMDALPLTVNGKIDRKGLPSPDETRLDLESSYVAPTTPEEKTLAEIWGQVLNIQKVGVNDNFFELGGDSILSLQIISKAKQAGLQITPRQLFQYQIIRDIAASIGEEAPAKTDQEIVTGSVALTPIQHWFFEHHPTSLDQFNTSMLLETGPGLDVSLLEEVFRILIRHHDALRMEFNKGEAGWQGYNAGVPETIPFYRIDLSSLTLEDQRAAIEEKAEAYQASFNLSEGPLLRVVYFDLGPDISGRMLIIFHHLVTDGVSWRIIMEDFQRVFIQLNRGEPVDLPLKTTSYRRWAQEISEYAQTEELKKELDYWLRIGKVKIPKLPMDNPDGNNTYGSTETLTISLSDEETTSLLREVPAVFGTQINDILLTALVMTLSGLTGSRKLLVEMEGHGREDIVEGLDLSRTIGWFTSVFPVLLDLDGIEGIEAQLHSVKNTLAEIPKHGIGFGLLRYLSEDPCAYEQMSALPAPEVNFNYLGQFDQMPAPQDWIPVWMASEPVGVEQSPSAIRPCLLYVVGIVSGGALHIRWLYSGKHHKSTIERLANKYLENLREIVAHSRVLGLEDLSP